MSRSAPAAETPASREFDAELEAFRKRIDSIDNQLLALLNARATVVADVYALKRRHGIGRLDRARTGAILDALAQASAGPLGPNDVRALFTPLLKFFVERFTPPEDTEASANTSGN